MKFIFKIVFTYLCCCASLAASAQKAEAVNKGVIAGLVKDSLNNYVLRSATVSVYKAKGNELIGYQLSNNLGKFQFKQMPVGIPLHIIATKYGYKEIKKEFIILDVTKYIDLGILNIERAEWMLKEVTIRSVVPPVQMRGDTLEFNAAAFKLDTTAVVEDLLRKLPGVTLWSDGTITVNGSKISRLLVEGKEFFGSDRRIALQNIPKNSVQKIQVYKVKGDKDPLNGKSEMNIVLKPDKKSGFFGKVGLGYATDKHYAADGMISYFSPRTQISVVGAANDVNKVANNVNTLMSFNSFKGEGINNDYHSDFRQEGLNIYRGTGLTFSQDFSNVGDTRKSYYKANILEGEFFYNNSDNTTFQEIQTSISLGENRTIEQNGNNNRQTNNSGFRSNAVYEKRFPHGSLYATYNFSDQKNNTSNTQINNSFNDLTLARSQSSSEQIGSSSRRSMSASIRASTERYFDSGKRRYRLLNADFFYKLSVDDNNLRNRAVNNFVSTEPVQNLNYDRLYLTNFQDITQTISAAFPNINRLFRKTIPRIEMDFNNIVTIHNQTENNDVGDVSAGLYQSNSDLTNKSDYITIDEKPAISLSRSYYRSLDNRFAKSLTFNILAQGQVFLQKSSALQAVQNISRSNFFFVPTARISYSNDQFGASKNEYNLNYLTAVQYPSISQLAPLIDRANLYSITLPNLGLKPAYSHQLTFNYNYARQKVKNDLNANIDLSAGIVEKNITDSVHYDELGRTIRHYINGNESKFINYVGSVNKAFKFKDHQINLTGNSGAGYSLYNTFVNAQNYPTHTTLFNASAVVVYTYNSLWSGTLGQYYSTNKTDQGELSRLTYSTWTTNLGFAFAFPRSVFFNTRMNLNNSKTSSIARNIYYTIWNADLGYRFLRGANAEVKISALDLLRQNRAITNYLSNNRITLSKSNVLQQYFMLTLAYYPRKFDSKK